MPKTGEVSYAKSIGPEGRHHAFEKPFSDPNCGKYLIAGEGHSKSPEAIEAVNRFRVTERDMPTHLIARRAREAGFRSVQILPQPSLLHKVAYDPPSRLGRRLGPLFRLRLFRALGTAAVFFYKPSRVGGLVVLTK